MRSFHKMFFASAFLLYTSCAEDTATEQSGPPSVQPDSAQKDTVAVTQPLPDSPEPAPAGETQVSSDTVPYVLREWERDLQSKGISFDLDNFFAGGTVKLYLTPTGAWNGEVYESYVLSPGGKYYSYFLSGWNDGDADTYVYLIDKEEKKEYVVNVLGTCCSYEGTGWIDDHTFIAIGYNSYPAEDRYPGKKLTQGFYNVYNLNTETYVTYSSKNFFRRPF